MAEPFELPDWLRRKIDYAKSFQGPDTPLSQALAAKDAQLFALEPETPEDVERQFEQFGATGERRPGRFMGMAAQTPGQVATIPFQVAEERHAERQQAHEDRLFDLAAELGPDTPEFKLAAMSEEYQHGAQDWADVPPGIGGTLKLVSRLPKIATYDWSFLPNKATVGEYIDLFTKKAGGRYNPAELRWSALVRQNLNPEDVVTRDEFIEGVASNPFEMQLDRYGTQHADIEGQLKIEQERFPNDRKLAGVESARDLPLAMRDSLAVSARNRGTSGPSDYETYSPDPYMGEMYKPWKRKLYGATVFKLPGELDRSVPPIEWNTRPGANYSVANHPSGHQLVIRMDDDANYDLVVEDPDGRKLYIPATGPEDARLKGTQYYNQLQDMEAAEVGVFGDWSELVDSDVTQRGDFRYRGSVSKDRFGNTIELTHRQIGGKTVEVIANIFNKNGNYVENLSYTVDEPARLRGTLESIKKDAIVELTAHNQSAGRSASRQFHNRDPYKSDHWSGTKNPFAHMRSDVRVAPTGPGGTPEESLFNFEQQGDYRTAYGEHEAEIKDLKRLQEIDKELDKHRVSIISESRGTDDVYRGPFYLRETNRTKGEVGDILAGPFSKPDHALEYFNNNPGEFPDKIMNMVSQVQPVGEGRVGDLTDEAFKLHGAGPSDWEMIRNYDIGENPLPDLLFGRNNADFDELLIKQTIIDAINNGQDRVVFANTDQVRDIGGMETYGKKERFKRDQAALNRLEQLISKRVNKDGSKHVMTTDGLQSIEGLSLDVWNRAGGNKRKRDGSGGIDPTELRENFDKELDDLVPDLPQRLKDHFFDYAKEFQEVHFSDRYDTTKYETKNPRLLKKLFKKTGVQVEELDPSMMTPGIKSDRKNYSVKVTPELIEIAKEWSLLGAAGLAASPFALQDTE